MSTRKLESDSSKPESKKKKKAKWYAVWDGRTIGVFETWKDCREAIHGYGRAKYKSFASYEEAKSVFLSKVSGYDASLGILKKSTQGTNSSKDPWRTLREGGPTFPFYCTDAACTNPRGGIVEYQCCLVESREAVVKKVWSYGPFQMGSNNIGEYVALVKALMWAETVDPNGATGVYTDSKVALCWVNGDDPQCRSHIPRIGDELRAEIEECDEWMKKTSSRQQVWRRAKHWNTALWGEIPADYGRKR